MESDLIGASLYIDWNNNTLNTKFCNIPQEFLNQTAENTAIIAAKWKKEKCSLPLYDEDKSVIEMSTIIASVISLWQMTAALGLQIQHNDFPEDYEDEKYGVHRYFARRFPEICSELAVSVKQWMSALPDHSEVHLDLSITSFVNPDGKDVQNYLAELTGKDIYTVLTVEDLGNGFELLGVNNTKIPLPRTAKNPILMMTRHENRLMEQLRNIGEKCHVTSIRFSDPRKHFTPMFLKQIHDVFDSDTAVLFGNDMDTFRTPSLLS